MRRTTLLAAAIAIVATVAVERASACSCFPQDPRRALARADGAFVGRLVSRRVVGPGAVFTFRVERRIKGALGRTVQVHSAANDAACGLLVRPQGRIGLFLDRSGRRWHSSLCQQIAPEALIAAAGPLPRPDGRGPVELLVGGSFGTARLLALDRQGRTIRYGLGPGSTVDLDVCPGAELAVEVVAPETRLGRRRIDVRRIGDLRLVHTLPVTVGPEEFATVVSCRDRLAGDVLVQVTDFDGEDVRLLRVRTGGPPELLRRGATSVADGGDRVYLADGGRLLELTLGSEAVREVARIPAETGALALSPDRTRIAGIAAELDVDDPVAARAVLVELATGETRVQAVGDPDVSGEVFWLDPARLVFLPSYSFATALTLDTSLRTLAAFSGWVVSASTVAGDTAWGISTGLLRRAELPGGPQRVARVFFSPQTSAIAAVRTGAAASLGLDAAAGPALPCVR
jgi:hypothetical protein